MWGRIPESRTSISDVIRSVHTQLLEAEQDRRDRQLEPLFETKGLTLEIQFLVASEKELKGGVKAWVVEAGASGRRTSSSTHKMILELGVVTPGQPHPKPETQQEYGDAKRQFRDKDLAGLTGMYPREPWDKGSADAQDEDDAGAK